MMTHYEYSLKPLMISEVAAAAFMSGSMGPTAIEKESTAPTGNAKPYGIITIRGGLYPSTYNRIASMLDILSQECQGAILDIDSNGGAAAGVFDLSDKIFKMRQSFPTYAIVPESCYSAAYAIASACNKIFITRDAGVGSIGVVCYHIDQSGFDNKMGLKYTPIFSGSKKVDFSSHAPLSDRATKDLQDTIDGIYQTFCETVGRNRSLAADFIKKTEAGIFSGQKAIDAGLVDKIMSRADALSLISKGGQSIMSSTPPKVATKPNASNLLAEDAKKRAAAVAANTPAATKPETIGFRPSYLH